MASLTPPVDDIHPVTSPTNISSLHNSMDVASMLDSGARHVLACAAAWADHQPDHQSAATCAMDSLMKSDKDTLHKLLCYYFFLNTAPLFASRWDPTASSSVVDGSCDPQYPPRVQLQLLASVTPVLACIVHDDPQIAETRVPAALEWLKRHVPAWPHVSAEQSLIMCIRVPQAIGAIALDLDDTVIMHSLLPGFKLIFSTLDSILAPAHTPLLVAMLSNAAPHLAFLRSLAAAMQSTQRPLFVTSYATAAWVQRAVALLLGDAVPKQRVLCRSDNPTDDAEVVDKNVWLTVVQRITGLNSQHVLLVDDSRRNVRAACAAGFLALQVDRAEGLHLGSWGPVCRALWERSSNGAGVERPVPDECGGTATPRGFEAVVDAELARVESEEQGNGQHEKRRGEPYVDLHVNKSSRLAPGEEGGRKPTGVLRRRLLSMLYGGSAGRAPAATHSLCAALDAYDTAFAKRGESTTAELSTPSALRLRVGAGEQGSRAKHNPLRRVLLVATGGAYVNDNHDAL